MKTMSFPSSRLLEVMAKGGGKTSTLNMTLLAETLEAIGWSVKPTKGFARLKDDEQFQNHPAFKPWLVAHDAETWGYVGIKEPKEIWFYSLETAEAGYKTFPVNIHPTPSTDFAELTVQRVDKPIYYRGRWTIVTLGWSVGVPAFTFTSKSGAEVTIPIGVDSRGRIADPDKTPMPSFWTWAYKNGLQKDAQEALAGVEATPKPAAPGDRTLDDMRTCPACMGNVKLSRGRIMRHGWSVKGNRGRGQYGQSWHTGPCFGVGYEPWEISPQGAIDYVTYMNDVRAGLDTQLRTLQSNPKDIRNPRYDSQYRTWSKEPETLTPGDPRYTDAVDTLIMRKKHEISYVNTIITETNARIATWVPKAMYGKVADRWLNRDAKLHLNKENHTRSGK